MLDLWAGVGGLCLALLALGVHIYAISAESDPEASAAALATMPNLVHIDTVEAIRGADLRPFLQRSRCAESSWEVVRRARATPV